MNTQWEHTIPEQPGLQDECLASSLRKTFFIVSSTKLYREGLATLVESNSNLKFTGASSITGNLASKLVKIAPHVLLIDTSQKEALPQVRKLKARLPESIFIGLALNGLSQTVDCLEAGFSGFLQQDEGIGKLVDVIQSATKGELVCSPAITAALANRVTLLANHSDGAAETRDTLTAREVEVLKLMEHGFSNKKIAQALSIEVTTTKNHVHHILAKLNVSSRMEAVAKVRSELGID